jgi:hypothetical protein
MTMTDERVIEAPREDLIRAPAACSPSGQGVTIPCLVCGGVETCRPSACWTYVEGPVECSGCGELCRSFDPDGVPRHPTCEAGVLVDAAGRRFERG